ncbi:hypothetical protein E5D57_009445 [Metarhizium anisopliae]|nr:hypothetical protein E5D57_009445 [Metarhizium anisopliae]
MLALSFLLCAAGVKAMLGIKIDGVEITDKEYICSENCAFGGAYFMDDGNVCATKELLAIDEEGEVDPEDMGYICADLAPGFSKPTRPLKDGEKPYACPLLEVEPSALIKYECYANRISSNKTDVNADPVLGQWSEVRKMLGLPASQEEEAKGWEEEIEPREVSF